MCGSSGWRSSCIPARRTRASSTRSAPTIWRVALRLLDERGSSPGAADEPAIVRAAALLHDIGHYPFSHALEEIGVPHHEEVARPLLLEGAVSATCCAPHLGADAPARVSSR
jgi:uncharacterized protein